MRPQLQRVRHDPSAGTYGDCFRTAIAAMLDLDAEEVPHVFGTSDRATHLGHEGHAEMESWLAARGLAPIWVPFDGAATFQAVLEAIGSHNPSAPFGVCGQSKPGVQHYVVGMGGKVVCDPSGRDEPHLIEPCTDGFWWVMFMGANLRTDDQSRTLQNLAREGGSISRRATTNLPPALLKGGDR